jgi:pilus assembly protein CpaB
MKMRGIVLLLLSLVSGVLAIAWLHNLNKPAIPEADASLGIVVAKKNLDFGDHISPDDLRVVKWPAGTMPSGSFEKIEDLAGPGEDRVVLRPMEANEPVLASKVSGNGGKSSLSSVIEADKRAVTIRVNDATGVAGFVQPGDHVDILLTHSDGAPGATPVSASAKIEVLLQDVLVRAIDQDVNVRKDAAGAIKVVTVEVSPRDAQKLTLASSIGTLSLTLRNMRSKQQVAPSSLSVKDLLPPGVPPVIAEKLQSLAAPKGPSYDIVRGTEATTYDVPREHGEAPAARVMGVAPTTGTKPN